METKVKYTERRELEDIYDELSVPLQKQLLTLALVMKNAQDVTLGENGKNRKLKVRDGG